MISLHIEKLILRKMEEITWSVPEDWQQLISDVIGLQGLSISLSTYMLLKLCCCSRLRQMHYWATKGQGDSSGMSTFSCCLAKKL